VPPAEYLNPQGVLFLLEEMLKMLQLSLTERGDVTSVKEEHSVSVGSFQLALVAEGLRGGIDHVCLI
jgi:hypothetical protein